MNLAVVINWRRPVNTPQVIKAIRAQTVPLHICLIECAYGTEWECQPQEVDTTIRISPTNFGPCSRFIAPLMLPKFEFVFFFVDDHLPGPKFAEFMLNCAKMSQSFGYATIGQQGRNVHEKMLMPTRITRAPVDCVVTSELVRTSDVPYALEFRSDLLKANPRVSTFEDDLILCMGIQRAKGVPSRVYSPSEPEETWNLQLLNAPHALCGRVNHMQLRNEFVKTALECGWTPQR
jgi:hypothetical protein